MHAGSAVWLFLVSIGASALGGALGMASGIFIVPILTIFGRIELHTAIGASLISVIACSCAGAASFLRDRLTNIRLAILLETATTFGALCGVFVAGLIPPKYLFVIFALILLLSAQQMAARRKEPPRAELPRAELPRAKLAGVFVKSRFEPTLAQAAAAHPLWRECFHFAQ